MQHQQNDVEASSNKWKSCHFLQKKEKPRLFGCVAYHYCWNCCSSHPCQVVLTTSQKNYPVSPRAGSSTFKLFSVLIWKTCDTRWIKSLYLASLEIIWEDNNWCSCKKQWEMCEHSQTGNQKSLSFSILIFESNNYRQDNSRFKWISFLFLTTTNFLDLQVLFPALFWVVFVYFMLQREKNTQLLKLRTRKYHW